LTFPFSDVVALVGLIISVGCTQAQKCHSNSCPVGVATTDENLMKALVVDEKKYRVMNYIVTLRMALNSLTAARAPTEFRRATTRSSARPTAR
jgi:glutamate synthase domain-containing protein 2